MSATSISRSHVFRGLTAAASLKLEVGGRLLLSHDVFRGLTAAASLKLAGRLWWPIKGIPFSAA